VADTAAAKTCPGGRTQADQTRARHDKPARLSYRKRGLITRGKRTLPLKITTETPFGSSPTTPTTIADVVINHPKSMYSFKNLFLKPIKITTAYTLNNTIKQPALI
jgi:hypothetical protein